MKTYLLIAALVSSPVLAWDKTTLIEYNADGTVNYDSRVKMDIPCAERWNAQTCKNIKVLDSLTRSTPEYQEGYYLKVEKARRAAEMAKEYARIERQQWEDNLRERSVRAAEQNAFANTMNALKPAAQIKVNMSQSQTIFH